MKKLSKYIPAALMLIFMGMAVVVAVGVSKKGSIAPTAPTKPMAASCLMSFQAGSSASPTPTPTSAAFCNNACTQDSQCGSGRTCLITDPGKPAVPAKPAVVGNYQVYIIQPGFHFSWGWGYQDYILTISESEKTQLINNKGYLEDYPTKMYAYATQVPGTTPIYHVYRNSSSQQNDPKSVYTSSNAERASLTANGWSDRPVAFYAYSNQVAGSIGVIRIRTHDYATYDTQIFYEPDGPNIAQDMAVNDINGGAAFYVDATKTYDAPAQPAQPAVPASGLCRNPACQSAVSCACGP